MPFAFRCQNCGRLHTSDDAAEAAHPHACKVCGYGVSFHPRTGVKTLDPDNWEDLADATDDRLEELGLEPHHVEEHAPWPAGSPERPTQHVHVTAGDAASADSRAGTSKS